MFVFQYRQQVEAGRGPEQAASEMERYLSKLSESPSESLSTQARNYALGFLRSNDLSKVPKEDYDRYWQAVSRALKIIGLAGDKENSKLSAADKKMVRAASEFAYPAGTYGTASSSSSPRPMPSVFKPSPFSWKEQKIRLSPNVKTDLSVDAESIFFDEYRVYFGITDPVTGNPLSAEEQKKLAVFVGDLIAKGLAWQRIFPAGPDSFGQLHSGAAENLTDLDIEKAISYLNKDVFVADEKMWDQQLLAAYRGKYGSAATKELWNEFTSRMRNKDMSGAYSMFDPSGVTSFTQFISSAVDKSEWRRLVESYRETLVAQWEIDLGGILLTSRKDMLKFAKEAEKFFTENKMPSSPLYYGAWIGANITGKTMDIERSVEGERKISSGPWEQLGKVSEKSRITYGHMRAVYSHQAYYLLSPTTISALTHVGEAFYDLGGYKYDEKGVLTLSNLPEKWKDTLSKERLKYGGTTSILTSPEFGNLSISHTGIFEGTLKPLHMLSVEARAVNRTLGLWDGPVALNVRYDKAVGEGVSATPGRVSAVLDAGSFYLGGGMLTNGLPSSITTGAQLGTNLSGELRYNFGRDFGPLNYGSNLQLRVGIAIPNMKQY